jgi:DNA-binding NarL/FixJ family response regulator
MVDNKSYVGNISKSVVLAHPDTLIVEGIAAILSEAHYRVMAKASTEADLCEQAFRHRPDIILFEPIICRACTDVIRTLHERAPKSVVALMTKQGVFDSVTQAIEAGASGCISVDASPEEFIKSIELLSRGDVVVSKEMANDIRKELIGKQEPKPIENLSDREREVLSHIGSGLSNRQIARQLFISENTVKVHVRSILNKLDLKNRQQAAVYASQEGLITHPGPKNGNESQP